MRETKFTLGPIPKKLYLPKSDISGALGDGTKSKTYFGCPRMVKEVF